MPVIRNRADFKSKMSKVLAILTFLVCAEVFAGGGLKPTATLSLSECVRELELVGQGNVRASELSENKAEFSRSGKTGYITAYNAGIIYYSGWQHVAERHIQSMKLSNGDVPVVIDAGGGTGRMTQKVMQAYPNATVLLLDANKDMEEYARENGVPPERIHLSDVTDMRLGRDGKGAGTKVPDDSVDHVYSHSVIWMLTDPDQFIAESSRVLKEGGRLSISSFRPTMAESEYRKAFVSRLEQDMQNAFTAGLISQSVRDTMINANKTITGRQNHTYLEPIQVEAMAARHGLKLVEVSEDVYEGTFFFIVFEKK